MEIKKARFYQPSFNLFGAKHPVFQESNLGL